METVLLCLTAILALSNAFLLIAYFKIKKTKVEQSITKDANQLLKDLMSGGAVAVVQVVDPKSMYMWSPKDLT